MKKIVALKQYLWLINLSMITALVYLGVDISSQYIRTHLGTPPDFSSSLDKNKQINNVKKSLQYYSIVQERNIFASSLLKEDLDQIEDASFEFPIDDIIEVTELRLKLLGTITWGPEKSRAIIENLNTKKQDIYRIGDMVEGAEIVDVLRHKVLLNNGGKIETLLAFDEWGKSDRSAPLLGRADNRRGRGRGRGGSSIRNIGKNKWKLSRKDIDGALKNMNNLMTQAMLRPHFENGKPAGFRVDRIKKNSMIEELGLKNGDVIKDVNGLNIDSPEKAFEIYRQLKNESRIKMKIRRNGRLEEFVYNIK